MVQTEDKTSEEPGRIIFDSDTVSSFSDTQSPYISNVYWSEPEIVGDKEERTIRIYCNEQLSQENTVTSSNFTVSGSAISCELTNINVNSSDTDTYSTNWIELTLSSAIGSNYDDLIIVYRKPETGGFTDIANVPNEIDSFELYSSEPIYLDGVYRNVKLNLTDVNVENNEVLMSNDGKYACIKVNGYSYYLNGKNSKSYSIYINDELWRNVGHSISTDYQRFYVYNEAATLTDSYSVRITVKDYKTNEEETVYQDMTGQTIKLPIEINGLTPKIDDRQFTNAVYSKSKKTLTFDSNLNTYFHNGCLFTITIDQVEYRLRGIVNSQSNKITFDGECLFNLTDKLDNATEVTLQYNPITNYDTTFYNLYDSGKPLDRFKLSVTIEN